MKAIVTKTIAATSDKPTRISAKMEGSPRLLLSMNCDLDHDANHRRAAMILLKRLQLRGKIQGGEIRAGEFAFVFVPSIRFNATRTGSPVDHPERFTEEEARELGAVPPDSYL